MRSLVYTAPSRLAIPFGVWYLFNVGNTLFNLLLIFDSDSFLVAILHATSF